MQVRVLFRFRGLSVAEVSSHFDVVSETFQSNPESYVIGITDLKRLQFLLQTPWANASAVLFEIVEPTENQ